VRLWLQCVLVLVLVFSCIWSAQASGSGVSVYFLDRDTAEPVAEHRTIQPTPENLVEELLKGPRSARLHGVFYPGTRLLHVSREGDTAVLDFDRGFLQSIAAGRDKAVAETLTLTLRQVDWLTSFRITVDGSPPPVAAAAHIDFTHPIEVWFHASPEVETVPQGDVVPHLYAMIDPGHGGDDPGAYNWEVPDSVLEKDVVLDIGTHVHSWIDGRSDATAHMTRYDDSNVEKEARCAMANNLHAQDQCNIFVSIHANSQADASGQQLHTAQGIETYYKKSIDQALAEDVHVKAKGAYFGSQLGYFTDRGTKYANFQVLRDTNMPACLVEAGFISNTAHDYLVLSNATHREEIAYHIYLGIRYYWWGY